MKREEAISLLRAMMATHKGLNVGYVDIVAPDEANKLLSDGYQLHIDGTAYHSLNQIEEFVKKYGLAANQENSKIIIFKPRRALKRAKLLQDSLQHLKTFEE